MKYLKSDWIVLLIVVLGIFVIVGMCLIQPYMEAKTFNKLTGKNVSTWDAMWVNLRVDGN